MDDLKKINETLEKINNKIEDKSPYSISRLLDFEKRREEARNEELLKLQKTQSENSKIQTESIKKQESFNRMVAFTGGILALLGIYSFLNNLLLQKAIPAAFWIISIIFLSLMIFCLGPLVAFVVNYYEEWILGKKRPLDELKRKDLKDE